MTQEEKARAYDESFEKAEKIYNNTNDVIVLHTLEELYPEFKKSEDERIRKEIIEYIKDEISPDLTIPPSKSRMCQWLDWLEKQGTPKKESIWKHWKDGIAGNGEGEPIFLVKNGNTYSLNSCLGYECDYIELSELDKLMLENQGEQNPVEKEFTFKAIPRLLEMIQPSERAKSYCGKLADTLDKEGYPSDANIVRESIKIMNGEKVPMATMDEQKPAWSEEDDAYKLFAISAVEDYYGKGNPLRKDLVDWLKSLKERKKGE